MKYPYINYLQPFDNTLFNAGVEQIVSGVLAYDTGVWNTGLVQPETLQLAISGLSVNLTGALPFGVLFGSGLFSNCHGIQTGQDTQSYTISAAGLLPGTSGTITGYIVAQYTQIQQTPAEITGPPPGHPAFNPTFLPYQGYITNVDSVNFVATTTVPDNATNIEICRFSLYSGQTGITALNIGYQQRVSPYQQQTNVATSGTGQFSMPASGYHYWNTLAGFSDCILPAPSGVNGAIFSLTNAQNAPLSAQAIDGSAIYGAAAPLTGASLVQILPYESMALYAGNGGYWVIYASPGQNAYYTQQLSGFVSGVYSGIIASPLWQMNLIGNYAENITGNITIPSGVSRVWIRAWGAGGGGAGGAASANFATYYPGGGGGGGYADGWISTSPGTVYNYQVGSGGYPGASGSSIGSPAFAGGTTFFGGYLSCSGGAGGNISGIGGAGGTVSTTFSFYFHGDNGGLPVEYLTPGGTGALLPPGGASFGCGATHQAAAEANVLTAGAPSLFPGQGGGGGWNEGPGASGFPGQILLVGF